MSLLRALASWPGSVSLAVALHLALAALPVSTGSAEDPLEFIDFELAAPLPSPAVDELPPPIEEPEPPPPPPPPPQPVVAAPAGPRNPDPQAREDLTSLESNRPDDDVPDEQVPLITGLALDADQLVEGGMGVRVGNTNAPGYDPPEPVAVEDIHGFQGGGAGGGGTQGAARGISQPARLMRSFKPDYPPEAKRDEIEGTVEVYVQVLANGRAGVIELVHGVHPALDKASIDAVRRFRWRPARAGGEKVSTYQTLRFVWRLEDA